MRGSGSRRCAVAAVSAGAALAVLAGEPARPASGSGVSGVVRVDGACITRCPGLSAGVTVLVREADSGRRVRTVGPRDGRFRVGLAPGSYTLTATSDDAPGAARRSVRVRPRRFSLVVLHLYTSVRAPARTHVGPSDMVGDRSSRRRAR